MTDPGNEQEQGQNVRSWMASVGPFLTLGLQLAVSVVAMFFLGRWLDQKFGTEPWLMIVGLALGATAGFINFFKTVITLGKEQDREASERKKEMKREG